MKLTPKALSAAYSRLELAQASEKITESFCDQALTVHSRLFAKSSAVFTLLLKLDDDEGIENPLDNVGKLHALAVKAGSPATPAKLEWVVSLIIDLYYAGSYRKDDLSVRALNGPKAGVPGIVELISMKQLIAEHLRRWATEAGFRTEHVETIRTVTESPAAFRKHCGVKGKLAGICQMWRAGWPASANQLISCYDNVVFGTTYDDVIIGKLKARAATGQQVMTEPSLQELLGEIQTAMAEEAQQRAGSSASSMAPAPPTVPPLAEDDEQDAFERRAAEQGIEADQTLLDIAPQLAEDAESGGGEGLTLERFKRQAELLVESNVVLANELQDDDEILKMLQAHPIATIRGDPGLKSHVLVYYDPQEGGETQAQPHIRTPPLRNKGEHLRRFIRLVMGRVAAAGSPACDELTDGDVYVINDTGKAGLKPLILNAFTNSKGEVHWPKRKNSPCTRNAQRVQAAGVPLQPKQ